MSAEPSEITESTGVSLDLSRLRSELDLVLAEKPWGMALALVGWIHLATFGVCQWLGNRVHDAEVDFRYPALWLLELFGILLVFRLLIGKHWMKSATLISIAWKIWITFLILSFNVASLNALTGYSLNWFKPVWAVLSTFVFAALSYLCTPWFLVGAVWMYFTGLAMVRFPHANYLIYGVSWWLALQVVGTQIHRSAKKAAS
jgi:hypothetical protein